MNVQVLKRYRDRDTRLIHEVGDFVNYEDQTRVASLINSGFIAVSEDGQPHIVTADDLSNNPSLVEDGVKPGETILLGEQLTLAEVEEYLAATGQDNTEVTTLPITDVAVTTAVTDQQTPASGVVSADVQNIVSGTEAMQPKVIEGTPLPEKSATTAPPAKTRKKKK